jgi:hypothetical protein
VCGRREAFQSRPPTSYTSPMSGLFSHSFRAPIWLIVLLFAVATIWVFLVGVFIRDSFWATMFMFLVGSPLCMAATTLVRKRRQWKSPEGRLRRGECPACTYPMGDSIYCTECGRLLPSRAERAQRRRKESRDGSVNI